MALPLPLCFLKCGHFPVGIAFAQAVTNKTFLKGFVSTVQAVADPERYMEKVGRDFVGSFVPGAVSQVAYWLDPSVREVNSIVDAVISRIPFARETGTQFVGKHDVRVGWQTVG